MPTDRNAAHPNRARTPRGVRAIAGLALATTLATALAPSARGQEAIGWASPVDGVFGVAGNWLPAVVPGELDTAVLAGVGAYTVRVEASRTVALFDIANPDATLALRPGRELAISGASGVGRILINDTATSSVTSLHLADGAEVSPDIVLNSSSLLPTYARLEHSGVGPAAIVRGAIAGRGRVSGTFDQLGGVDASDAGDHIEFNGATVTMAPDAPIDSDAGAAITIIGSTISGGEWFGGGGAALFAGTGGAIDNAAIDGRWLLDRGDQLVLGGQITGLGEIVVNDAAISSVTTLQLADGADVSTNITLNSSDSLPTYARLDHSGTGPAATVRGVIAGRGRVMGAFDQVGGVDATEEGDHVEFSGATVAMAADASIDSDIGGAVGVIGSTISGGTWDGAGGATLFGGSGGTVRDTTIEGRWILDRGDILELAGAVAGEGEIVVNDAAVSSVTTLRIADGADISTDITLNSNDSLPTYARLDHSGTGPAASMRGTIAGRGRVMGAFDHVGGVDATGDNDHVEFNGAVVAMAPGAVVRSGTGAAVGVIGSTITGGTWDGNHGATLFGSIDGTIRDAAFEGRWILDRGDALTLAGTVAGPGEIVVNDAAVSVVTSLRLADGADVAVDITLNSAASLPTYARLDHSGTGPAATIRGTIAGRGRLSGTTTIAGTLAPGMGVESVDRLELVVETMTLAPGAEVEIDAGGTADGEFDRISGGGGVVLDGSLSVNFVEGYVPDARDQYEIIAATTIDGSFADIDIEPVGAIGPAHIVYTGDSVILVICAADRDADGELTIFDFLAFQNLFDAGDLRADLDEDGQLTIFDFLVFQNRFDAGCG